MVFEKFIAAVWERTIDPTDAMGRRSHPILGRKEAIATRYR